MFESALSSVRVAQVKRLVGVLVLFIGLALGHGPVLAAPPPDAPSLEEAGYLERFRGDLEGAERIYRALSRKEEAREVRAEALYRLGALLLRRGASEGAQALATLAQDFPERRDLLARAEAALARTGAANAPDTPSAEPTLSAQAEAAPRSPPGRILARRTDGLFAFSLGRRDGLAAGLRCDVLRDGRPAGLGLVLRVTDALAAAKLLSGEAAPGDQVLARAPEAASRSAAMSTTASAGAPVEPLESPALLESARIFLDAIAASAPTSAGASAPQGILLEARAVGADASFVERLPFAFERAPQPRPEGTVASPEAGALLARLTADAERLFVERLMGAPDARVYRAERTALRPGARVEVSLSAPVAPRAGVKLGLRLLADARRRPGAAAADEFEVEVDLTVTERGKEPALFPGAEGPIAVAAPRSQRLRALVRLARDRPAVVLAGVADPFAEGPARRELLITLSFARPPPEGLDR